MFVSPNMRHEIRVSKVRFFIIYPQNICRHLLEWMGLSSRLGMMNMQAWRRFVQIVLCVYMEITANVISHKCFLT